MRLQHPLKGVRIVTDATTSRVDLEARLREAYQKGFADASANVNQQILEQRSEMNHLRDRLFRSFETSIAATLTELREALPELTMQALRRTLARAEITRETVATIVDELLAEIGPDVGPTEIRLNPADLRLVEELEPQLARIHPGLRFVADEALGRGDSQAVTRYGKVDARIENKLAKLEASILPAR